MLKTILVPTIIAALAAPVYARPAVPVQQTTKPPAAEAKPEIAAARAVTPEPPGLPVNIRIDVSITDQTGTGTPAKKVVSMIASDRQPTNIRSNASVPVAVQVGPQPTPKSYTMRTVTINVDARPQINLREPNKVLLNFGLEYLPSKLGGPVEESEPGMTTFSERLGLILESGKPMVISQAADPTSDRKITVEVTATILK